MNYYLGFVCPPFADELGHYADPEDCSKYFECHDNKPVHLSCAPGFLFDATEGVCDFSENVNCGKCFLILAKPVFFFLF